MSAWLCSQDHINLIVNAHPDPEQRNGQSFHLLLNENLRSLDSRYSHRVDEHADWSKDYQFEAIEPWNLVKRVYAAADEHHKKYYPATGKTVTAPRVGAQVRHSCDSFDYQSCENDDYYETPAAKFVQEVRDFYKGSKKLEDEALWSF